MTSFGYTYGDATVDQSTIFVYDGTETSPLPPAGEGPGVRAAQIMLEFDKAGDGDLAAGDLSRRFLWGTAVDQLMAEETADDGGAEDVRWPLTDHLGTVRDEAQYTPGTPDSTTITNHRTYTGRVRKLRFFKLVRNGKVGQSCRLPFFKDEHVPGWQNDQNHVY